MVMSNPRAETPEDAKVIPPHEGHEHGYYGYAPGADEDATVAGVTGGTDQADSPPSKGAASRVRSNTAALKKGDDK